MISFALSSVSRADEIVAAGMPAPSVIQLQLSPFNQHRDVVKWAVAHNSILSCAAWSKLSSVDGPVAGWTILADIAKAHSATKVDTLENR